MLDEVGAGGEQDHGHGGDDQPKGANIGVFIPEEQLPGHGKRDQDSEQHGPAGSTGVVPIRDLRRVELNGANDAGTDGHPNEPAGGRGEADTIKPAVDIAPVVSGEVRRGGTECVEGGGARQIEADAVVGRARAEGDDGEDQNEKEVLRDVERVKAGAVGGRVEVLLGRNDEGVEESPEAKNEEALENPAGLAAVWEMQVAEA